MNALSPQNLPSPKEESWKYTNLPKAMPDGLIATPDADEQAIEIHIPKGEITKDVHDIAFAGVNGALHSPRLKITLEEGAELTILERHTGEGSYWKNMSTDIIVGANAKLHHIRLQEDSLEGINTNIVNVTLGKDAIYDAFTLNTGAKLTRHEISSDIHGENAELSLNGINLLSGMQHGDTTILIEHTAPHCRSNQFYRTILDDSARGVFQGKVHVHKIAQKTDGYQLSNAILLSEKAEMDTKPELEIYADDVRCSHGATTGQLDEEPVFYLRSRGLSEKEARELLIQAFVDEVVDKIVDEDIQASVREKTGQWLTRAL